MWRHGTSGNCAGVFNSQSDFFKTHDLDVGWNKWKSSACQEYSCYDSGGIKAIELRRRWCFGFMTKCKHGYMERSKMSMSSPVGLKVQKDRNKIVY